MNPKFRSRNQLLMMALAAVYPAASYAAGAARVEFAFGNVVAVTATGSQRELTRGSELQPGEAIRTGDNARAQLRFSDGGMMSLQPQTEFRIDEYRYSGKTDGSEKGFFSLIKGGLRTITGAIGHGSRDNYRVNTPVATIGIRGTEYSAVFTGGTDGVLNLATGEGAVEICNAGGCVIVASGESAIVTGSTPPKFTPLRPSLPPSALGAPGSAAEPYMPTETRSSSGTLGLFGADLASGSDYAISWAFNQSGSYKMHINEPANYATFESGSKLVSFSDTFATPFNAGTVKAAFSVDGVIGWGTWSDGTYFSSTPLTDLHYVVGKPTGTTDLNNLSGMTATYQMIGYTTPTSTLGYTGSSVQSSMTAEFSGGYANLNADLSMTVNGTALSVSASGSTSGSAGFNLTGTGAGGITANMNGFFVGSNASHAGLTYKIDASTVSLGEIGGAVAYKQGSIGVTQQCQTC
ncbi:MAG TPA: FecR family protein [Rhodocyclaceae bacterium]|nr:FecR family protein [Rhodocyclaceae bacterium]